MNPRSAFLISLMERTHDYVASLITSASASAYNPVVTPQLTRLVEAWFTPLMETTSPLLEDFPVFLIEFEATFREMD